MCVAHCWLVLLSASLGTVCKVLHAIIVWRMQAATVCFVVFRASQGGSQQDDGMMDIEAAIQALEAEVWLLLCGTSIKPALSLCQFDVQSVWHSCWQCMHGPCCMLLTDEVWPHVTADHEGGAERGGIDATGHASQRDRWHCCICRVRRRQHDRKGLARSNHICCCGSPAQHGGAQPCAAYAHAGIHMLRLCSRTSACVHFCMHEYMNFFLLLTRKRKTLLKARRTAQKLHQAQVQRLPQLSQRCACIS